MTRSHPEIFRFQIFRFSAVCCLVSHQHSPSRISCGSFRLWDKVEAVSPWDSSLRRRNPLDLTHLGPFQTTNGFGASTFLPCPGRCLGYERRHPHVQILEFPHKISLRAEEGRWRGGGGPVERRHGPIKTREHVKAANLSVLTSCRKCSVRTEAAATDSGGTSRLPEESRVGTSRSELQVEESRVSHQQQVEDAESRSVCRF